MQQPIEMINKVNEQGLPAGGCVFGEGIDIEWQDGPLGRDAERKQPNGAFVEDVLRAVINRIKFYQDSKFNCRENAIALTHCETALLWLEARTREREARGVEGTHQP